MKTFKAVPAIKVEAEDGTKKPLSMLEWLTTSIERNSLFGKGFANISAGLKIKTSLEEQFAVKDVESISLEDEEYKKMADSIEMVDWIPRVAFNLLPYFEAFRAATEKKNKPKKGK